MYVYICTHVNSLLLDDSSIFSRADFTAQEGRDSEEESYRQKGQTNHGIPGIAGQTVKDLFPVLDAGWSL